MLRLDLFTEFIFLISSKHLIMLTKKIFIFLLAAFVMASCSKEESFQTDDLIIANLSSESFTSAKSVSNFVVIKDHVMEIDGTSSTLRRNEDGMTVNFKTNGLIPGNAYTMWWVIFGDAPGPPVLVTYATGHIASGSGKGNFSSHINVGDIFDNPLTAETHIVLRSHGQAQQGVIPSQIHTIDGGCAPDAYPSGPVLYADSDELGYCANIQVAIHH